MLRLLSLVVAVALLGGLAQAQSFDRLEVFGGYSYVNNDFSLTSRNGMQGWNASATFDVARHFGLTADFSGWIPSARVYSFLFGPQLSFKFQRVTPFAHVLFGNTIVHYNGYLSSGSSVSYAAGGGVDFRLSRRLALRGQVDWLHTNFHTLDSQGGDNFYPNVARVSTGIVIRF
jgi:hypothetical protein